MNEILRFKENKNGCPGVLLVEGELFCLTLEPDANDPDRFQIPEGCHACKLTKSISFGWTYEIIVEGHSVIYFHWGNKEEDSTACVLLGMKKGINAVWHSRTAFNSFMKRMDGISEFILRISRHGSRVDAEIKHLEDKITELRKSHGILYTLEMYEMDAQIKILRKVNRETQIK